VSTIVVNFLDSTWIVWGIYKALTVLISTRKMQCDGCDGCGKTYPELKQIYFCKCFLVGFCSPECFEQSGHKAECELIEGPVSRLRCESSRTDFGDLLSRYARAMEKLARKSTATGMPATPNRLDKITDGIVLLDGQRQKTLISALRMWNAKNVAALNLVMDGEDRAAARLLEEAGKMGKGVVAIFKEENRQTRKDIRAAWEAYTKALYAAIMSSDVLATKKGEQLFTEAFNNAAATGLETGKVLAGGKRVRMSGELEDEAELIEGPFSRVKGKSNYGELLSNYTKALGKFAMATGNADKERLDAMMALNSISDQVRDAQRKAELKLLFETWNKKNLAAITARLNGNESEAELNLDSIKTASNNVIAIFKSENKISFRQSEKTIERSWNAYLQSLREAILSVPKRGGDMSSAERKFDNAALLAISVGRVLGGGKDVEK